MVILLSIVVVIIFFFSFVVIAGVPFIWEQQSSLINKISGTAINILVWLVLFWLAAVFIYDLFRVPDT